MSKDKAVDKAMEKRAIASKFNKQGKLKLAIGYLSSACNCYEQALTETRSQVIRDVVGIVENTLKDNSGGLIGGGVHGLKSELLEKIKSLEES
ncbi:MAG: hypothetical protein ACW98X_24700 [Promethearchaeota archaeon]|jgi:hypothetical protein